MRRYFFADVRDVDVVLRALAAERRPLERGGLLNMVSSSRASLAIFFPLYPPQGRYWNPKIKVNSLRRVVRGPFQKHRTQQPKHRRDAPTHARSLSLSSLSLSLFASLENIIIFCARKSFQTKRHRKIRETLNLWTLFLGNPLERKAVPSSKSQNALPTAERRRLRTRTERRRLCARGGGVSRVVPPLFF